MTLDVPISAGIEPSTSGWCPILNLRPALFDIDLRKMSRNCDLWRAEVSDRGDDTVKSKTPYFRSRSGLADCQQRSRSHCLRQSFPKEQTRIGISWILSYPDPQNRELSEICVREKCLNPISTGNSCGCCIVQGCTKS